MTSKALKIFWKTLKVLAFLLFAGLLVVFWNLYRGEIGLGFITPLSVEILTPDDSDLKVKIEKSELTWTKSPLPIGIKVSGFKMLNREDKVVSAIPEMKISLSLWALLSFKLALGSMEFDSPYVHMFVAKDGNIGVGFNPEPVEENLLPLTSVEDKKSYSDLYTYLTYFRISRGKLAVHDELTDYSWVFPDINVVLTKSKNYIEAEGQLNLQQNNSFAPIQVVGVFDNETSLLHIDAEVANLYLNESLGLKKLLANSEISVPLSGTVTATLDFADNPSIEAFRERFKKTSFALAGEKGNIFMPEPIQARYDIKSFALKGEMSPKLTEATITDLAVLAKGKGSAVASVKITNLDKALDALSLEPIKIEMKAKTKNIPLDNLKWYWPAILGTDTHTWVVDNINGGMVDDTSFDLLFTGTKDGGLEMEKVRGVVNISGATVRYLESMPLVHDVSGQVILNKDDVRVKINKGKSLGLDLYYADLFFYDIWEPIEKASMKIKAKGSLHDALVLVDTEPMGFLSAMGLKAEGASGYSDTDLQLDFPLRKDLTVEMVKVTASSKITKATFPIVKDYPLENADLSLQVNNEKMTVSGVASVKDVNVNLLWNEVFTGKKAGSFYDVSMLLDKEGREAFGMDFYPFADPVLSGITGLKIKAETFKKKPTMINIDADLTEASLYEPMFGIVKKKSIPAAAKIYLQVKGNDLTSVDSFKLSAANGLDIRGRVDMAKANKLKSIYLDRVVAGRNNASADILFLDNGSLNIKLKATSVDAVPFLSSSDSDDKKDASFSYSLQGRVDKLWLSQEGYINKVDLRMTQKDSWLKNAYFKATTANGKKINSSFLPDKEVKGLYNFSLWGGDAGEVLKALGYTKNIKGGILKIEGTSKAKGELSGRLRMKEFRVVKAPVLAKILSVASLTGVVDLLQGEGIGFDAAMVPFEYKKSVLYIKDAHTSGLSIGLTANGNLLNNTLNVEGTIVPAYVFNSFLGKIPLLGALFSGGEEGGGLFAFTYDVKGDITNPKISVNPLSALAPGFIRSIFTGYADINEEDDEDKENNESSEEKLNEDK